MVLGSLEDALARVEQLAGSGERGDARELTHVAHDLPSGFARRATSVIASARQPATAGLRNWARFGAPGASR